MTDTNPDVDAQIAALAGQIAGMGTAGQNDVLPTPIGVPKYQVTETGDIAKDASGKPIPWSVVPATGTVTPSPFGATSRIDPGAQPAVPARYYSHDGYTLIDPLSPEDVYQVQREMIDAGILDVKGVVAGNWTSKEATAFTNNVLSSANAAGTTWDVVLHQMAANGRANPKPEKKVQRPAIEVSKANPFALGQVADRTAETMIGRRLNDSERARFVEWWSNYEDQVNAEQVAAKNAEENDVMPATGEPTITKGAALDDVTPGMVGAPDAGMPQSQNQVNVGIHTLHTPMSAEDAAAQFLQQNLGGEMRATDQLKVMHDFLGILGASRAGGVSGRPGA